jgi:hypothetical protein
MSRLLPILLALILGRDPAPENKLAVDNECDGVTELEGDCDDGDADQGPEPEDEDCDGVGSPEDCDDTDALDSIHR